MFFIWDDWNRDHIAKHGIETYEAEFVVRQAQRPYPRYLGNGKFQVKGRTVGLRRLQVIYVERPPEQIVLTLLTPEERIQLIEGEAAAYVIHARELRRGE